MAPGHPVSALIMMTFGVVLFGLVAAFVYFMRKRSNRHSMDAAPERGEPGAPDKPRGVPLTPNEAKSG